jgi:hypothetical protein
LQKVVHCIQQARGESPENRKKENKMDKVRLFRRAHEMAKTAIAKFGGNYLVIFVKGC